MGIVRLAYNWIFGPSCSVYVACKMTGRDKSEMVKRARFVCEVLTIHGVRAISPVLEEDIKDEDGKLVNHDLEKLAAHWRRDKQIIRRESRVMLIDHGEMKSMGFEREYCLNRGVLWKPTVMYVPQGTPLSVAQFEDDLISSSIHVIAKQIDKRWGCRWDYWKWRIWMLVRSLPKWIVDQIWAWK